MRLPCEGYICGMGVNVRFGQKLRLISDQAFHPNGMSFVTSNAKGVIVDWEIPEDILDLSTADAMTAPLEHINEGQQISWGNKLHGNNHIGM